MNKNLSELIMGGPSRYTPGRACDYILLLDEAGIEIAYAEELIPAEATEQEADWDDARALRLIEAITDQRRAKQ